MILIADSGSTKCSWALCDSKGNLINEYNTVGFNPYFINKKKILHHLEKSTIYEYKDNITNIRKKLNPIKPVSANHCI